jgi:hypothetical protein
MPPKRAASGIAAPTVYHWGNIARTNFHLPIIRSGQGVHSLFDGGVDGDCDSSLGYQGLALNRLCTSRTLTAARSVQPRRIRLLYRRRGDFVSKDHQCGSDWGQPIRGASFPRHSRDVHNYMTTQEWCRRHGNIRSSTYCSQAPRSCRLGGQKRGHSGG